MITAKLIDHIWATRKADALNGYKLMLVEIIGGRNAGERMVVADVISAGIGDRVIVTTGSAARRMLGDDNLPIDAVIVGIIDGDCKFDERAPT
ncbi:MAG: EutN/CcmL family microcompartment protein [Clostridiales Family XIII bacterium]|jgi:ethanolamine utilization protein EutN|nr:EutN/CcmL family microcompartment protein [Clostridiales Family XIII bacterium]